MSDHPRNGERVFVRPRSAAVPVQRAEGIHGQFLPTQGAEALWDDYLHRRFTEGVIEWRPLAESEPAPPASEPLPAPAPDPAPQENG